MTVRFGTVEVRFLYAHRGITVAHMDSHGGNVDSPVDNIYTVPVLDLEEPRV